jgi:hypothetical protein
VGDAPFRTIGELADICGAYCWLESRLFELTGSWASAPAPTTSADAPEARVFFSEASAERASLAAQWHERLPVRAGVDPDALVIPPAGPVADALRLLDGESGLLDRLAGLVEVILPHLLLTYEDHLVRSSPVSEAPVRAVLELACWRTSARIALGRAVVHGGVRAQGTVPDQAGGGRASAQNLEGVLRGNVGIFPAVRAS